MKQSLFLCLVFLLVVSLASCVTPGNLAKNKASSDIQSSAVAPEEEVVPENYVIGPGDTLHISAWKNEDLTRQVTVLPDGTFSFPLIGAVKASGKTASQLKNELERKITPYSPEPNISVMVFQVNSCIVYVIGRANRPGMFPLNTDVTVLQALAMAGGLTPFADKDSIKIFRTTGANTQIFKFDYDDVSKGKNLEQNIVLQRGDVIVVP